MSGTTEQPIFAEEVTLLAEKLAELTERLSKAEADLAAQTAPLDANHAAQDAALAAVSAALAGIKALNFHVLGNDLGAVSKRVESLENLQKAEATELATMIGRVRERLDEAVAATEKKLAQVESTRVEFAHKQDADAQTLAQKADRTELQKAVETLAGELESARKQFAAMPKAFNPRGEWDALQQYKRLDVVSLNGSSYIAICDNCEKPTKLSRGWTMLARRGSAAGVNGLTAEEAQGAYMPLGVAYNIKSVAGITGDGVTDCQSSVRAFFATLDSTTIKTVIFPPGYYYFSCGSGSEIALPSNLTVIANGATFLFPTTLDAERTLFMQTDVENVTWIGGKFVGYVFDPLKSGGYALNTWTPRAGVQAFWFKSTGGNGCANIALRNVDAKNTGLAVLRVSGVSTGSGSASTTSTYADGIVIDGGRWENCGRFYWDYGYLWQLLSFEAAGSYSSDLVAMANAHIEPATKIGAVTMTSGTDLVAFDNSANLVPAAVSNANTYWVTFYGTTLPSNITRGLRYYVVDSSSAGIKVSATYGGAAITFASSGSGAKMLYNMYSAFYEAYVPVGADNTNYPAGTFVFQDCKNITVRGLVASSAGDLTYIRRCVGGNFNMTGTGARMGSIFFIQSTDLTWSGYYDGGNGSRIITSEGNSARVVFENIVLRGGGRGCLFDSPREHSFIGAQFYRNNTKNYNDYALGRIDPQTSTWQTFPLFYVINDTSFSAASGARNMVYTGCTFDVQLVASVPTFDHLVATDGFAVNDCNFLGDRQQIKFTSVACTNANVGINTGGPCGIKRGIHSEALVSASSATIPHGITANAFQGTSVTYRATAVSQNNVAQISYVTCDATNVTAYFTSSVTGTVSIAWEARLAGFN